MRIRNIGADYLAMLFDGTLSCANNIVDWLATHGHMAIVYDSDPDHIMLGLPQMKERYWVHPGYYVLIELDTAAERGASEISLYQPRCMGLAADAWFSRDYEITQP